MLHLHFANRLETLRTQLIRHARATPRHVFEPLQVLVPSLAMRRHLMLAFAAADGVCANVRFEFLAQWLWAQPQGAGADVPALPPLAPARLAWRVLAAFDDEAFVAAHPRLAAWLGAADPVMRYELAQRSAALIEQYATYRADWMASWSAGRWAKASTPLSPHEGWQAALWRRLDAERPVADPLQALAGLLATHAGVIPGVPAAVHVFALPTMPPLHLQLLQGWAGRCEVHVYALNPCREYWFDAQTRGRGAPLPEGSHPLLVGWGAQTRQQLEQLVAATGEGTTDDEHYTPHGAPTLLGRLHDSLLEMAVPAPGAWAPPHGDRSIELHVCHSLTRQIEVLHDRLLGLFGADPTLRAGEVLVVVPDLEAAAPLIDAVFGSAPPSRALPYNVTGRPGSQVNAVARAFLALLELAASRLHAAEVFALLQQPPVARRFALDAAALDLLREAIGEAGIRWGLDAAHRGSLGLPATALNTWADGLQRLLLGHLVADSELPEPFAGVLPAGGLEGSAAACLGVLVSFVRALATLHEALSRPLSPVAWRERLADCIQTFIEPDRDDADALRALHAALDDTCAAMADNPRAALAAATAPPTRLLSLAVVQAALVQRLDDPAHGGVPGGSITFSSMSSLRGLPYPWVCVLGLDDDSFPSKTPPDEFDLIALTPRAGDRQRRSDERALFLDLVLAARRGLHLSHTGRSVRDNAPLPPSVLVSELIDFLVVAGGSERSRLVVEHPLQPFSASAFAVDGDPRIRSHHAEMAAALWHGLRAAADPTSPASDAAPAGAGAAGAAAPDDDDAAGSDDTAAMRFQAPPPRFFDAPLPPPGDAERRLDLPRLTRFFADPARALLRGRLGLEWAQDRPELEDTEPLLPDHAARRAVAERVLPALLAEPLRQTDARALAAAGNDWPDGSIGTPALAALLDDLQRFAGGLRGDTQVPLLPASMVGITVELDGVPWSLDAAFVDLRATGLLRWRFDALDGRGLLSAWLEHLLLCHAVQQGTVAAAPRTTLHRMDGRRALRPVVDPGVHLAALMRLYADGQREPLPVPPRAAWAFVQARRAGRTEAQGLAAARTVWFGNPRAPTRGEGDSAAWRLALRGAPEPIGSAFAALADAVFTPILDHLDEPG